MHSWRALWPMMALMAVALLAATARGDGLTLRGTVVDADGRPAEGARVDVATAKPRHRRGDICPSCYPDCRKATTTDTDGQFRFDGLDPSLTFRLLVTKPGSLALYTDPIDPLDAPSVPSASADAAGSMGRVPLFLSPAPSDVPKERMIRGRLVDESARPVPGALLSAEGEWTGDGCRYGAAQTSPVVSDDEGRFVMIVPEALTAVSIGVSAEGFAGTLVTKVLPGQRERSIRVPRGATVTARVVHDGKPCPGLRLAVVQTDRVSSRHFIRDVPAVTDAEGIARFEHLPAAERYCIFSETDIPQALVIETTLFKAPENEKTRDLGTTEAVEPRLLAGRLSIDGGGEIPAGTRILLLRDPAWDTHTIPVAADGTFEAPGLPPEGYRLRVAADGFTIDGTGLNWQFVDEQYAAIPLQTSRSDVLIPLIAGTAAGVRSRSTEYTHTRVDGKWLLIDAHGTRVPLREPLQGTVIDPDGQPVAGVHVEAKLVGWGDSVGPSPVRTDDQGRFTLESLPALPLEVLAYRTNDQSLAGDYLTRVAVSPGESDVRVVVDPRLPHRYPDLDPPVAAPAASSFGVVVMRGLMIFTMWWTFTCIVLPSMMRRWFGGEGVAPGIPSATTSGVDGPPRQ